LAASFIFYFLERLKGGVNSVYLFCGVKNQIIGLQSQDQLLHFLYAAARGAVAGEDA
jgi:hypothetical protein